MIKKFDCEKTMTLHENWIDIENRTMWIHSREYYGDEETEFGVEHNMAVKVIKNLHILKSESESKPVTIFMHTCGGMESDGFAIYDAISSMPFHVTIISCTYARSMSSIILQAADERVLFPSSYFMMHRGDMGVFLPFEKTMSYIDLAKKYDEKMMNIYAERMIQADKFSGFSKEKVIAYISAILNQKSDWYLTPEDAILHGLADSIYGED